MESRAPVLAGTDYASPTLVAFTSAGCEVCKILQPSFDALRRGYPEIDLRELDLDAHRGSFDAFNVRSTPYVVVVDATGIVRGRGVVNSLEQIEELLDEAGVA